jgi:precorrin-6B methylase 2
MQIRWLNRLPGRLRRWRGWTKPAVQALAMQLAAALLTGLLVWLAGRFTNFSGFTMSIGHAVLLQAVLAALLTACLRLAAWWVAMALLFSPALLATVALHLPPAVFLAAFLFLLLLYWSTFRTQVPFYPSGAPVWKAVEALLPARPGLRVLDIGSGLGGLVLHLARARTDCIVTGIELAPLPWAIGRLRAACTRSPAGFIRGDYEQLDFSQYDVIFAYLSPAAMSALWQKAQREMQPGSLLLSHEFLIEDAAPQITVLPHPHGPFLYGWHR